MAARKCKKKKKKKLTEIFVRLLTQNPTSEDCQPF